MTPKKALAEMGYPWPGDHPGTGEPFVKFSLTHDMPAWVVRHSPPGPPSREVVTEWDDDGPIAWRTLTKNEYAKAVRSYKKATAEWRRTGGVAYVRGADTIRCRF